MKNNQQNRTGTFLYLTQVKEVLFTIISATSYYWFLGSTPIEIAHGIYGQQFNYEHENIQAYAELIWHVWQCVHNEEARRVSIP